eukprot:4339643-Prymnesium_polylepis.1
MAGAVTSPRIACGRGLASERPHGGLGFSAERAPARVAAVVCALDVLEAAAVREPDPRSSVVEQQLDLRLARLGIFGMVLLPQQEDGDVHRHLELRRLDRHCVPRDLVGRLAEPCHARAHIVLEHPRTRAADRSSTPGQFDNGRCDLLSVSLCGRAAGREGEARTQKMDVIGARRL